MTVDEALRAQLSNNAGVTALVEGRITPMIQNPANPKTPYITYQRISGRRAQSLGGHSGLANPRYQIDVWATTADVARAVGTQVRLALEADSAIAPIKGRSLIIGDRDDYDSAAELFRVSADYSVWHVEETAA